MDTIQSDYFYTPENNRTGSNFTGSVENSIAIVEKNGAKLLTNATDPLYETLNIDEGLSDQEMDACLYQYAWKQSEINDIRKRNGNWLIFDDNSLVVDRLSSLLKNQLKGTVTRVTQKNNFRQKSDGYKIRPDRLDDYKVLLNSMPDLSGIAYFWGSCPVNQEYVAIRAIQNTAYLLNLAKSLADNQRHADLRLYVVTRNAQKVLDTDARQANAHWPLIGMRRVMFNELPDNNSTLVDIDKLDHHVNLGILTKELLSDNSEDEVALRNEHRYSHHLQRTSIDTLDKQSIPTQFRTVSSNRSYKMMAKRGQVFFQNSNRRCPENDEIEIKVQSIALCRQDYIAALATENVIHHPTFPLGSDIQHGYTAKVTRVGPLVEHLNVGDQLLGYAKIELNSYLTLPSHNICAVKTEPGVKLYEAASIPEKYLPLYYALSHKTSLGPDDVLLVNGAFSEKAKAAVQIGLLLGATVLVTSDKNAWKNEPEYYTISAFVDQLSHNFINDLQKITKNAGINVILNLNTLATEHDLSDVLAPCAQIIDFVEPLQDDAEVAGISNKSNIRVETESLINNPVLFQTLLAELLQKMQHQEFTINTCPVFSSTQPEKAIKSFNEHAYLDYAIIKFHDLPALDVFYSKKTPALIKQDVTYLITGSFAPFGKNIARWLVAQGVTNLVLVDRPESAEAAGSQKFAAELKQKGAEVFCIAADMTKKSDVERLFKQIETDFPPLYGLFHAESMLNNVLLSDLDEQCLYQAMAPAIRGAWNLHLATAQLPLKHFVLLTSDHSLIGNVHQTNQAAVHSFFDQLAVYRHNLGLSAVSVNYGAIDNADITSQNIKTEQPEHLTGMKSFSAERALDAFSKAYVYDPVQLGIMDVNWNQWSKQNTRLGISTRFKELNNATSNNECLQEDQDQHSDNFNTAIMDELLSYLLIKEEA